MRLLMITVQAILQTAEHTLHYFLTRLGVPQHLTEEIESFQEWLHYHALLLPITFHLWALPITLLVLALLLVPYRQFRDIKKTIAVLAVVVGVIKTLSIHDSTADVLYKVHVSTLAMRVYHICILSPKDRPTYRGDQAKMTPLDERGSPWSKLKYSFLLMTDLRFESFETSYLIQYTSHSVSSEVLYCLIWFVITYVFRRLFPMTLSKCLFTLHIGYIVVLLPDLIRGKRARYIFYRPFAASSVSIFWTRHWHTFFLHFFQAAVYKPMLAYTNGSHALATCVVFLYSAIWHSTFFLPVVEHTWEGMFDGRGMQWNMMVVFITFLSQGPLIILEQVIFGKPSRENGFMRRAYTWLVLAGTFSTMVHLLDFGTHFDDCAFLRWIR